MPDDAESVHTAPVALVGAGAVGTALARRLVACGHSVRAILSRDPASANALAERVGASVGATEWTALPSDIRLVMICVPDDALPTVAEALAAVNHPWADTLVGDTSGARTAGALAPLQRKGATTLSFHPLQTFAPDTPPEAFSDIVIAVEGNEEAVSAGHALAQSIGARPVQLTASNKVRYHCAAALASNGLVALLGVVQEILDTADLDAPGLSATDLVKPLVEQTWANLQSAPAEHVLTGPVARGDCDTVQAHLEALSETSPHLVPLYVALSTEMTRLAIRAGSLSPDLAEELLKILRSALPTSSNGGPSPDLLH